MCAQPLLSQGENGDIARNGKSMQSKVENDRKPYTWISKTQRTDETGGGAYNHLLKKRGGGLKSQVLLDYSYNFMKIVFKSVIFRKNGLTFETKVIKTENTDIVLNEK